MKINPDKVKERLAGVPESQRSHIYNAAIVLEFLAQTFMPTKFFLPANFEPTPGLPLGQKSMRAVSEGKSMTIGDLYNLYQLFREEKDYTARIESRYIFGIIVRNLRYYKNGWEFTFWRVGVAQIWHVGPLVLRSDVPAEVRKQFAAKVENTTVAATTVEADPVTELEPEEVTEEDLDRALQDIRFTEAAPSLVPCEHENVGEEIRGALRVTVCRDCGEPVTQQPVDEGF